MHGELDWYDLKRVSLVGGENALGWKHNKHNEFRSKKKKKKKWTWSIE